MPQFERVTIYAGDDVTVLDTFSTDPAHAHPWLIPTGNAGESSIDFVEGRATIGQVSFRLLDKRTIAADQDSGYVTAMIAAAGGLLGNKVVYEKQRRGSATYYKVFVGTIIEHPLDRSLVSYTFGLRDIQERQRTASVFTRVRGTTILPLGTETGYGYNDATGQYLVPPQAPLRGVFWRDPTKPTQGGRVKLNLTMGEAKVGFDLYKVMQGRYGRAQEKYSEEGVMVGKFYPGLTIKWRPAPYNGAWTTWDGATMPFLSGATYSYENIFPIEPRLFELLDAPGNIFGLENDNWLVNMTPPAGQSLPAHQQAIEILVLANGFPTDEFPQFIDENFGDLLEKIGNGYYAAYAPGMAIEAAALASMKARTGRARAIITGSAEAKAWKEENIYKPNGYAPSFNDNGEEAPIRWELPDATAPLLLIDDSVVRDDAKWTISDADAVNVIVFETYREYLRAPSSVYNTPMRRLISVKDTDVAGTVRSQAKLGLKEVTYKPVTVRNFGTGVDGGTLQENNLGTRLRKEREAQVKDRFEKGGQRITAYCLRGATGIQEAKEGDWTEVSISWLPEFGTGRRGTNRLMQIVKIMEDNEVYRGFELLDAGSLVTPTAQPTLGAATQNAEGVITIPVTAVPAGGFARLDYAVAAVQPASTSGAWQYAGRLDAPGSVVLPAAPSGATVWHRARGEKAGVRRSAWTNAVSTVIAPVVRIFNTRVEIGPTGVPTVYFEATGGVDAVRINYDVHVTNPDFTGALPAFANVTVADGLTGFALPVVVQQGEQVVVQATPYRLGAAHEAAPRVIEVAAFDTVGAPLIEVKLLDGSSSSTMAAYQVNVTTPDGIGSVIYYAFGDDPFVSTVANGGIIAVPRATNDSGDRLLRIKAVADNGISDTREITVDFDVTPEIAAVAEAVPIIVGNAQVGWRLRGTVDDDTRTVTVLLTAGLTMGATGSPYYTGASEYWIDTTSTKTWTVDLLQSAGQKGTVTITPRERYNESDPGMGGQPFILTLERPPVTTHSIREVSATEREVTLSVTPTTATIKYRVDAGTWIEAVTGKVTFVLDVEAAPRVIEYYSYTASGTVEEVSRVVVDQDSKPGITSTVLTESEPNNLHLDVGFDDDVVMWRMWARRNAYPTADGTWTGRPLDQYKRYDGGTERTSLDWYAGGNGDGTSTWYVLVYGYDDVGDHVYSTATKLVSGAPPAAGSLSNVSASNGALEGGLRYNELLWNHNQTVQDTAHSVTVRESDNGAAFVQLTIGRDARLEHDGGALVALVGGFHVQKPWVAAGTPGAVFHTYNYEIDLRKTSDNSLVATYTASTSGWEAGGGGGGGAPPAEIPNTLAAFGEVLQARGTWNNTSAVHGIHIEWERNAVLQGPIALAAAVATHTITGMVAGDDLRFRVRYYNGYGNGSWSAWSSMVEVLPAGSPPTETPADMETQGASLNRGRGKWTNTSAAYALHVEFWVDGVYDRTAGAAAGETMTAYENFTLGDMVKTRARYYNNVGNGPWAAFSDEELMH